MPQTTQPCSSSHVVVGANSAGTIINGGPEVDTFTPGTGYDGGNHYVASAQDYQNGFNAFGSCTNYAGLACRVTVNYNTNIGQGFDANGDLLWTDTYSSVEQVKAAELNGNVVTGVNSHFRELKGGLGSTTSMTAPPATGSFGAQPAPPAYSTATVSTSPMRVRATTSLLAQLGRRQGRLELRPDDLRLQRGPGDDLNLSEFATAGFAGVRRGFAGANDLVNWVNVSLTGTGDTVVQFDKSGSGNFTQTAVTLKRTTAYSPISGHRSQQHRRQQVVQDM